MPTVSEARALPQARRKDIFSGHRAYGETVKKMIRRGIVHGVISLHMIAGVRGVHVRVGLYWMRDCKNSLPAKNIHL